MGYFLDRLYLMYRVIEALVYRESKTRFGQKKIGYIWIFLEPIAQIAVFAAIFGVVMGRIMPGIDYLLYLSIGVIGWNLFNDTLNRSLSAVQANQGLLVYNRVKPIDTVLARAILEGIIFCLILPTILIFLHLLGHEVKYFNLFYFLIGFSTLWLISVGLAMFFAVLATIKQEFNWIITMLLKPLYFMSGVMYSVSSLPGEYQKFLFYNPIIHSLGMLRKAFIENYTSSYIELTYIWGCCLFFIFMGIAAFVSQEHRLRMD